MKPIKKLLSLILSATVILSVLPINIYAGSFTVESTNAPFNVFEQGSDAVFTVSGASGNITATLLDYENVSQPVSVSGNSLTASDLKLGHFRLTVSDGTNAKEVFFAVVPKLSERRNSENTPFRLSAMVNHSDATIGKAYPDSTLLAKYANTLKLAGITRVREFFNADLRYNGTSYKFDNAYSPNPLIRAYDSAGIKTMLMYHTFPDGTWDGTRNSENKYPTDLREAYTFAKEVVKGVENVEAIEIMNEPDISETIDGPEKYAAMLKASAIGIWEENSDIKISMAGVVKPFTGPYEYTDTLLQHGWWQSYPTADYHDTLLQNDISDYIDIYNYHNYIQYADYLKSDDSDTSYYKLGNTGYSELASKYVVNDKEIYVGESGIYIPHTAANNELTHEEQINQAQYATKTAINNVAQGADGTYFFSGRYINESGKSHSMFSQENQPYVNYSALSALINAIGDGKYYGTKNFGSGITAHIFYNGEESTTCIWSDAVTTISLGEGSKSVSVADIMGNEETLSGNSSIDVGPSVIYVRMQGLPSGVQVVKRVAKAPAKKELSIQNKIVVYPEMPTELLENLDARASYILESTGDTVKIHLYNFNNTAVSGTLNVTPYCGWKVNGQSSFSQEVEIAAGGVSYVSVTLSNSDPLSCFEYAPILIDGTFNGEEISRSVVKVRSNNNSSYKVSPEIDWNNTSYWTPDNTTITDFTETYDENEDCITFSGTNGNSDYIFPIYEKDNTTYDFSDTDGLYFEMKVPENSSDANYMIYVKSSNGIKKYCERTPIVDDEKWHKYIVPWESLKGTGELNISAISQIQIGLQGLTQTSFSYSIRNIGGYSKTPRYSELADVSYENNQIKYTVNEGCVPLTDEVYYKVDGEYVVPKDGKVQLSDGEHIVEVIVMDETGHPASKEKNVTVANTESVVQAVSFSDENGDNYIHYASGNTVKTDVVYENKTGADVDVQLFLAAYDEEGNLLSVSCEDGISVQNNGVGNFPIALNVPEETSYIKCFAWDTQTKSLTGYVGTIKR